MWVLASTHNYYMYYFYSELAAHYPHFPSEQECTLSILGSGNVNQHLSKFVTSWERLQVGGALLPDLVELYTWLHKNLAYVLTLEKASEITIGHIIELIERKRGKDLGKHMRSLYEKVEVGYNRYVGLIGGAIGAGPCAAMHRGNKITKIKDEIPILHFLSGIYRV